MANIGGSFDHTSVDQTDNFAPIPAGEYIVEVVDSDVKQTRSGDGEMISVQLRVVEGPFENRRIFTNLNHRNPNPATQAIGERQLAQLCSAVGLPHALEDTVDLHNVPVKAQVTIQPEKNGYPERNQVRAFKPVNGPAPAPHITSAAAPSAAAKPAAPWKR